MTKILLILRYGQGVNILYMNFKTKYISIHFQFSLCIQEMQIVSTQRLYMYNGISKRWAFIILLHHLPAVLFAYVFTSATVHYQPFDLAKLSLATYPDLMDLSPYN
jgi:hypothetical protein